MANRDAFVLVFRCKDNNNCKNEEMASKPTIFIGTVKLFHRGQDVLMTSVKCLKYSNLRHYFFPNKEDCFEIVGIVYLKDLSSLNKAPFCQ